MLTSSRREEGISKVEIRTTGAIKRQAGIENKQVPRICMAHRKGVGGHTRWLLYFILQKITFFLDAPFLSYHFADVRFQNKGEMLSLLSLSWNPL